MNNLSWTIEKKYYQRQAYFDNLVTSIQQAKKSIELETYIFDCDLIGQMILSELKLASERGVKVRILVDGIGAFFEISKIDLILSGSSVQFKIFHPLLFPRLTQFKWLRFDLIFHALKNWNRRLHRKVCIIDKRILFLGSFNITDNTNRETGALVMGSSVFDMVSVFEIVWNRVGKLRSNYSKLSYIFESSSMLRLNYSRIIRKSNRQDLCQRITLAKKKIWITNAYFIPPPMILKAILAARNNGIEVEILVPSVSDLKFMKLLTETYYRGLLTIGVKIYEYKNVFLHAKSLIIDEWAIIGSSNLNYRSFFHDLEVDIVLTHPATLLSLENQFELDRANSIQITLDSMVMRPWLDRIFIWFLSFLRSSL